MAMGLVSGGEDVAYYAADAGGGAPVRLYCGRVVVTLDVDRDHVASAHVNHARVKALAGYDGGTVPRQLPEVPLGRLVGAVLGPLGCDDLQFGGVRIPADLALQVADLIRCETHRMFPSTSDSKMSDAGL